ncbi:carboxypeptidase-like regulatory domain-containing protein [Terasakiella pusilla]|jgi:hypothetical protein|uniref:carboxypeptidase-like regulatory domain-containing protein n=1 Tax=Terasakiella pusilla TaxID=64973 RepID=UPI003AA8F552
MSHYSACLRLLGVLGILWGGVVSTAHAHGVNWTQDGPDGVIVLAFEYSDGTQMAFATVKVSDPDNRTFQSARTDRRGRFALAGHNLKPAGEWVVSVNDGQGHVMRVPLQISDQQTVTVAPAPARSEIGVWPRALFGLSLIANLTIVALWVSKRRRSAQV